MVLLPRAQANCRVTVARCEGKLMSIQVIKMPDIGEGIAEVEIVEWHVAQGDTVAEDQVLVDVMTDKASVEIPAPVAGVVARLGGEVGDTLAVGAELLAIEPAAPGAVAVADVDDADASSGNAGSEPAGESSSAPTREAALAPSAAPVAATPLEPDAQPEQSQLSSAAASTAVDEVAAARVLASPSVRYRARQLGIDLAALNVAADAIIGHGDLDQYLLQSRAPAAVSS